MLLLNTKPAGWSCTHRRALPPVPKQQPPHTCPAQPSATSVCQGHSALILPLSPEERRARAAPGASWVGCTSTLCGRTALHPWASLQSLLASAGTRGWEKPLCGSCFRHCLMFWERQGTRFTGSLQRSPARRELCSATARAQAAASDRGDPVTVTHPPLQGHSCCRARPWQPAEPGLGMATHSFTARTCRTHLQIQMCSGKGDELSRSCSILTLLWHGTV